VIQITYWSYLQSVAGDGGRRRRGWGARMTCPPKAASTRHGRGASPAGTRDRIGRYSSRGGEARRAITHCAKPALYSFLRRRLTPMPPHVAAARSSEGLQPQCRDAWRRKECAEAGAEKRVRAREKRGQRPVKKTSVRTAHTSSLRRSVWRYVAHLTHPSASPWQAQPQSLTQFEYDGSNDEQPNALPRVNLGNFLHDVH
jgi:hypothetical protein